MKIKLGILVVAVLAIGYFCYNPLVIYASPEHGNNYNGIHLKGDTINVFKDFDFDRGDFTAYLLIREDSELSGEMPPGKVFKTTDTRLLRQMQEKLRFTYTGGDMATVTNELLLLKDGKILFSAGIVLDDQIQGLQSSGFGWIRNTGNERLSRYCSRFRRVYLPVVIL